MWDCRAWFSRYFRGLGIAASVSFGTGRVNTAALAVSVFLMAGF